MASPVGFPGAQFSPMPASWICQHTLAGVADPSGESDEQPDATRSAVVTEKKAKIFNEFIGLFFRGADCVGVNENLHLSRKVRQVSVDDPIDGCDQVYPPTTARRDLLPERGDGCSLEVVRNKADPEEDLPSGPRRFDSQQSTDCFRFPMSVISSYGR